MSIGDVLSPASALLRFLLSFFVGAPGHPHKRLEAYLLERAIVAELPDDFPFSICDEGGGRYQGVYVIGLLLWNKGNQPVVESDFISSAPLQIEVGADANIVSADVIPVEDQTICSTAITTLNRFTISFDCVNPSEYLAVSLFVTGNPMTEIRVTGRFVGQDSPIDHTAGEVKASIAERVFALILLVFVVNALPGLLVAGWLILEGYGIAQFLNDPEAIPTYLMFPFSMGAMMLFMFVFSRVMYWLERRRYPEGYPLHADLEPPLLENVKGMFRTVFQGRKQRVSVSLFDWGKPILMPSKNIKRRTVDDWVR